MVGCQRLICDNQTILTIRQFCPSTY